jgi:hypothetical protein
MDGRLSAAAFPVGAQLQRAVHVTGPTTPSTPMATSVWKFLTASSVWGPKMPSTTPGSHGGNPELLRVF